MDEERLDTLRSIAEGEGFGDNPEVATNTILALLNHVRDLRPYARNDLVAAQARESGLVLATSTGDPVSAYALDELRHQIDYTRGILGGDGS